MFLRSVGSHIRDCTVLHQTDWLGGNDLDSYSGGAGFEYRPGLLLCEVFMISSVPPSKC
jgi:hypothetical protein